MSYKAIITDYFKKCDERLDLDYYKGRASLAIAIESAAKAFDHREKRHSHQRLIPKDAIPKARDVLLNNQDAIGKCKNFDDLFCEIELLLKPIHGISELYIYDACVRIGAFLNLYPERVYLHRGTRCGAKIMRKKGQIDFPDGAKSLDVSIFPVEFQTLEPYEIEGILCEISKKRRGAQTAREAQSRRRLK